MGIAIGHIDVFTKSTSYTMNFPLGIAIFSLRSLFSFFFASNFPLGIAMSMVLVARSSFWLNRISHWELQS